MPTHLEGGAGGSASFIFMGAGIFLTHFPGAELGSHGKGPFVPATVLSQR